MPHVVIKLYPGRTEEQKKNLAEAITKTVMEGAGCSEKSVSVSIEDVQSDQWVETVYKPDILGKPDTLYKKPGYEPL